MGNKSSSKSKKYNRINREGNDDNDDTEGFFLEDWVIVSDKSKFKEYSKNNNKIINH